MGALTTHVLDTAQGRPGAGILVELFDVNDGRRRVTSGERMHEWSTRILLRHYRTKA